MPDVSARRKYVSLRGEVFVVPERMTKKIMTKDPARKMRAGKPNDGSAKSHGQNCMRCRMERFVPGHLRPAMIFVFFFSFFLFEVS